MTSFASRILLGAVALSGLTFAIPVEDRNITARDTAIVLPPSCYSRTETIEGGDPHQNYLHKQVSQPITCSQAQGCSVSRLTSYTIGWFASIGVAQWITGGFTVTESYTTGETYTCNGNPGDTVCVWINLAHTAYTVENTYGNPNYCNKPSDPFVLKSPNTDNRGGGYYCVVGTCRNDGDEYWVNEGPAGGPP